MSTETKSEYGWNEVNRDIAKCHRKLADARNDMVRCLLDDAPQEQLDEVGEYMEGIQRTLVLRECALSNMAGKSLPVPDFTTL